MAEKPRCQGAGEIEVGTRQDEFGNWDTETYKCPGCPDCLADLPARIADLERMLRRESKAGEDLARRYKHDLELTTQYSAEARAFRQAANQLAVLIPDPVSGRLEEPKGEPND